MAYAAVEAQSVTFPAFEAMVRELANGTWAISSLILIGVLVWYVINKAKGRDREYPIWWKNPGVQMAAALLVLMLGHALRSVTQWIQFIIINSTHESFSINSWWSGWRIFVISTALVVAGKILCVLCIADYKWRWCIVAGMIIASILFPLITFEFL